MGDAVKNAYIWVAGGREYDDHQRIYQVLSTYHEKHGIRRIVTGGATGADYWAREWADFKEIPYVVIPAKWSSEGKAAGPRRNERIAKEEQPDALIAFPGGDGTNSAIKAARLAGIPVFEIDRKA